VDPAEKVSSGDIFHKMEPGYADGFASTRAAICGPTASIRMAACSAHAVRDLSEPPRVKWP
jgi:hypothetical protein